MPDRCRISSSGSQRTPVVIGFPAFANLRFPTDSKAVNGLPNPYPGRQETLLPTSLVIGLERAFTELPVNIEMLHADVARRD